MPRWPTPAERFAANWVEHPSGCHIWTAAITRGGYGRFRLGKEILAHRAAWILKHGLIPPGLTIDHVRKRGCLFRHCVNTEHMELVTRSENSRRTRKEICLRGHDRTVNRYASGACSICVKEAAAKQCELRKAAKGFAVVVDSACTVRQRKSA